MGERYIRDYDWRKYPYELMKKGRSFFEEKKYEDAIGSYETAYGSLGVLPGEAIGHLKEIANHYLDGDREFPDDETLITLADLLLEFDTLEGIFPTRERGELAFGLYESVKDLPEDRVTWMANLAYENA